MNGWMRQVSRSAYATRERGLRTVAMFALGRLLTSAGRKPLHYKQRPALSDLNEISEATTDPSAMAELLGCSLADFQRYLDEFEATELAKLHHNSISRAFNYPANFASEFNTQRVLYSLIRAHRPSLVLETGVADGFSSYAMLLALKMNGDGVLHSIDLKNDVGSLIPTRLRDRWTLHINDRELGLEKGFKEIVAGLPGINFYYHDSGHSYLWQSFEYATVAARMPAGSVFLSDDVDCSYAFIDYCRANKLKPALMVEARKVIGGYSV